MGEASILTHMSTSLMLFLTLVVPPLGAALVVGVVIGIIQAATQIQDQTLPLMVKLLVIVAVLGLLSPVLAGPLIEHAKQLFTDFPALTASG
ncbi:flagellar biosynthetic protein FliQ [Bradyrhizobium sp. Arg237L]|uniref:EscS/YscS/HrcS family type III secretion system export apparatus protein n=1 Tax=Bradyrhizobium sp. Arg237L TaxID=3003352 RepID=UPI00249F7F8B|nr:flagellar biosynthetic protein FliQ [Bradyrhizobium sp. Arg237L]MDI4231926.1 flagellar biosynthetic protein FliQ [Bradyrhizobium sp. Arg237L]